MPKQPLIVGNPVLVVVDMQESGDMPAELVGIAHMAGYDGRIARAQRLIAAARAARIPIVFFQEVHRPNGIDFGRELDGAEGEHCVDGRPGTPMPPWRGLIDEHDARWIARRLLAGLPG